MPITERRLAYYVQVGDVLLEDGNLLLVLRAEGCFTAENVRLWTLNLDALERGVRPQTYALTSKVSVVT